MSKLLMTGWLLLLTMSVGAGPAPAKKQAPKTSGSGTKSTKSTEIKAGYAEVVTSRHVVRSRGKKLRYTAKAGEMVVDMGTDKPKARFFFIAYHQRKADSAQRPVTFAFNGGPGASAVWLHLGGLGPRTLVLDKQGRPLSPPSELAGNPQTWLAFTDLIFIDPVGTGYSRSLDKKEQSFWGVKQDVKSVAEFIRLYLTLEKRWLSPKFLVGESYGTTRAASLAGYLDQTFGIRCNGLVLISPALDYAGLSQGGSLNLPFALFLPGYAAAKKFHDHGMEQDWENTLQSVETFALGVYLNALHQGDHLPSAKQEDLAARLSSLTGLSREIIAKNDLRIPFRVFVKEFYKDQERILGRMDATITGIDPHPAGPYAYFDPSLMPLFGPFSSTFNHYIREELKYEQTLPYEFLNSEVARSWDWSSAGHGGPKGQGYVNAADDLKSAMTRNPHLKVFVATGYFDLATPYFASHYTVGQMGLHDAIRRNIGIHHFKSGHMIYLKKHSKINLFKKVMDFYQQTLEDAGK